MSTITKFEELEKKEKNSLVVSARFTASVEVFKTKVAKKFPAIPEEEVVAFYESVNNGTMSGEESGVEGSEEAVAEGSDKPKGKKEKKEKTPKEPKPKKEPKPSKDVVVTTEMQAVIDDTATSKSNKFRKLYELGMSVGQITRTMNTHYSFVRAAVAIQPVAKVVEQTTEEAVA